MTRYLVFAMYHMLCSLLAKMQDSCNGCCLNKGKKPFVPQVVKCGTHSEYNQGSEKGEVGVT